MNTYLIKSEYFMTTCLHASISVSPPSFMNLAIFQSLQSISIDSKFLLGFSSCQFLNTEVCFTNLRVTVFDEIVFA